MLEEKLKIKKTYCCVIFNTYSFNYWGKLNTALQKNTAFEVLY